MCTFSAVNECIVDSDGCEQMCTDTLTSYLCSCHDGYRLDTDKHNCNGTFFVSIFAETFFGLFQILMNVLLAVMDVNKCVKTLRDHTCVVVEKAIL